MAQKPDEIDRDIEARRQLLHARVRELRGRAQGDVHAMQGAVKDRVDSYTGKVDDVRERALGQVDQHPYMSLAGGFGLGFALGIATPELSLSGASSDSHKGGDEEDKGLLGSVFGALMGVTTGQIMQEVRGKVQEQLSDLVHKATSEKEQQAPATSASAR